jgi:hypothetical protein
MPRSFIMNNPSQDPRNPDQQHDAARQDSKKKSPKVGQPGEEDRTSQENAGSTEGGGTRNARN